MCKWILAVLCVAWPAMGQIGVGGVNNNNNNGNGQAQVFGISVDPEGQLVRRAVDQKNELSRLAARGKLGEVGLKAVSLRKLAEQAKESVQAGKPLPDDVRYMQGLTQIRYVIVDLENHDLLIAGPAEAWDAANPLSPRGKQSGRPVVQFDDFVVMMRAGLRQKGGAFGCSIDPAPHAVEKGLAALKENPGATREQLAAAVAAKLGPQPVRCFGIPADTRAAFVCVAADYQLKHYTLGLEVIPVPGAGIPVDQTRPAGNGFWFEANFQPLLVSADGRIYEIRGPRLQVKAGAIPFDPAGATERAMAWSKTVSANMDKLAASMPIYAEVQNFADLSLLASLIRVDRLEAKAGLDLSWVLDTKGYQPIKLTTPRSAKVVTNFTNGSLVAGGVKVSTEDAVSTQNREKDEKGMLESAGRLLVK